MITDLSSATLEKENPDSNGNGHVATLNAGAKPARKVDPLTQEEKADYQAAEETIRQGWQTFVEVGEALCKIRKNLLYREDFDSWEDYCRERWLMSKTHANRLINASNIVNLLTPAGAKVRAESQVRPLFGLNEKAIPQAWRKAEEFAGGGEVTAEFVQKAVDHLKGKKSPTPSQKRKTISIDPAPVRRLISLAEKAVQNNDVQGALKLLGELRGYLR